MKRFAKYLAAALLTAVLVITGVVAWQVHSRQPVRSGEIPMLRLQAPVSVAYDERGVPHIRAGNEADMYRALGYVHAQDRLFQMEMVRRLARGELAEVLGPRLLETDKLFRTLGIRDHADRYVKRLDPQAPGTRALHAYLDGINQFQDTHPSPIEFAVLGIPKRPFVAEDTVAVSGYLAYSFAAAFNTEPVLTFVRDQLGPGYLRAFDTEWHAGGVTGVALGTSPAAASTTTTALLDWGALDKLASLSHDASALAGMPLFEGSNAWAIAGVRTASGKPLLAGDPHIMYSTPAVWYEAHLSAPGFELYGHFQALNPVALLGHNRDFGWSLTMFQNDDLDLIAERPNPANPAQVWGGNGWVDLQSRTETIAVKGSEPVALTLRRSAHGPIITEPFKERLGTAPVAMWWAFLETDNPVLEAFYELNRADTLAKARAAASRIHAPGLNVMWANAAGDIGWWAAARLPRRPAGVNPVFILDAAKGEAEKLGFHDFSDNPQEENPARGYIVSANHQPGAGARVPVPGYYNHPDRARQLDRALSSPDRKWDIAAAQALQLDDGNAYAPRMLASLVPVLRSVVKEPAEQSLLDQLARWDGRYGIESTSATLFNQLLYETARAALADELGPARFKALLYTRAVDYMLPRLVADADSPWWDDRSTPQRESRADILLAAWRNTLNHLRSNYGDASDKWQWGRIHTLLHNHPLGLQKPLDKIFSVGPFGVPGTHETPNNLTALIGPAPWAVVYGPSTRRVIDFADASRAVGINPVGQSGVLGDTHYSNQAELFAAGRYVSQHLSAEDVRSATRSTLTLRPSSGSHP